MNAIDVGSAAPLFAFASRSKFPPDKTLLVCLRQCLHQVSERYVTSDSSFDTPTSTLELISKREKKKIFAAFAKESAAAAPARSRRVLQKLAVGEFLSLWWGMEWQGAGDDAIVNMKVLL